MMIALGWKVAMSTDAGCTPDRQNENVVARSHRRSMPHRAVDLQSCARCFLFGTNRPLAAEWIAGMMRMEDRT
ncbi:hypothetical protein [Burkholderia sp.]|jgi:hypothetical protein|nr:hypothetical protein [Burkholderia sp.]MCA3796959.1 hypothetical protein [Burkholderia sp.]MCA3826128.1 hypothetical protein [Burkholderia sp.]MCA3838215.1 hypothetical protein [Burkholderia sp.]MCA3846127.1 hypothetical protein [Burkholderia sp.]MCA3931329.1 hypothetical protein [Burkholderia sp.]